MTGSQFVARVAEHDWPVMPSVGASIAPPAVGRWRYLLCVKLVGWDTLRKRNEPESERAYKRVWRRIEQTTLSLGGQLVDTQTHQASGLFDNTTAAASAASQMHRAVAALPGFSGTKVELRIGLCGSDSDDSDALLAIGANMANMAAPGQTLACSVATVGLPVRIADTLRFRGLMPLAGRATQVHELQWQRADATGNMSNMPHTVTRLGPELRIRFEEQQWVLDAHSPTMNLGRHQSSEIRLHDAKSSRRHARIVRREHDFIFTDHSSNGTVIDFEGRPGILLHDEEITLTGRGWIFCGLPGNEHSGSALRFDLRSR